nr:hypothetical protein [Thioflexithrix psekupsensis]
MGVARNASEDELKKAYVKWLDSQHNDPLPFQKKHF